jgi:inorganic pyrophosphatase
MSKHEELVEAFIEIPMGSRNKYEYDPVRKRMYLDRVLYASVVFPTQYGFIPETKAPDGDPLDILVLADEPVFPGCLVAARLLGVLRLHDKGEDDCKILGVTAGDPRLDRIKKLHDVAPEVLTEIENFFWTYKDLEGKNVEVRGWEDVKSAEAVIARGRSAFMSTEG